MTNTENAGIVVRGGSTPRQPLTRLNPREIATLLLPGTATQVMDATDVQFQAFVTATNANVIEDDPNELWSFDDRVRFINHWRRHGVDLFVTPNTNNSPDEQKTIQNNLESIPCAELFAPDEQASQADVTLSNTSPLNGLVTIMKVVLAEPENSSEVESK